MILDEIVEKKKIQLQIEKQEEPLDELIKKIGDIPASRDFASSLKKDGISVIAEIKKASPSKGIIKEDFNPVEIAKSYEKGDADAISVLTEKKYFMGNDSYIKTVRDVVTCPVLRKDFIVDEYQIYQSKVLEADAILLITAVLGNELKRFYDIARTLNLQCLVEIHNEAEADIALSAGVDVIGINNRDLRDFSVDLKNTERLIKLIPDNVVKVSESGIKTVDDVRYLRSLGVDAVLIGETFMRSDDIISSLKRLKGCV